ncbi:MAG: hypothetical protein A2939_02785 [Parcubacteria group bacterium RIFCSPLOWO2_01_FULL_48_18]|nr:MAG: hypothetical protein A2939_02785 [Parcubacteria group bacterium RIFCSPLOWO2_01_FULL_48_18]OHB23012.1 MAG: hypothetical protein A3J67_03920 [Parcubacteria group bacterium RIFCSPHIGHO2_02_FULL_48_10b]
MPDLTKLRYEPVQKAAQSSASVLDEAEVDRSVWKAALLAVLTCAFAFGFSLGVRDYFLETKILSFSPTHYMIFIAGSAVGFSVIFFLQSLFLKSFGRLSWMVFLNAVALSVPFYDRFSQSLLLAAVVVYLLLLLAARAGWSELRLLLKVRFFRLCRRVFPKVITVMALFISLVFYIGLQEGKTAAFNKDVFYAYMLNPLEGLLRSIIPDFDFEQTGDEIIADIVTQRLEDSAEAKSLTASVKKQVIEKSVSQTRDQIESFLNIDIDFKKTAGDGLYELFTEQIVKTSGLGGWIVGGSIVLLAFLVLKALGIVFGYTLVFVSFIVFELLIAVDFARIVLESRTREIIIMK